MIDIKTTADLKKLNDQELILLVTGKRSANCREVHQAYQAEALSTMVDYDMIDLKQALNLTPAATKRLGAALELHRRMLKANQPRTPLRTPEAVAQLMLPEALRGYECLWCLCLNARCELIGDPIKVSQGDVDGCEAGPRLFYRNALRRSSVSVIAVHNHPSGNATASPADVAVTKRLIAAGATIDLSFNDHVIITANGSHHSIRRSHPELWA